MKHIISTILFCIAFAACKKDSNNTANNFDPTKYYIVITKNDGAPVTKLTGIMIFGSMDAKPTTGACSVYATHAQPDDYDYSYQNGHLKIIVQGSDKEEYADFTITDNQIKNAVLRDYSPGDFTYTLYKIPDTDQFNGNTFVGTAYQVKDNKLFGSPNNFEASFKDGKINDNTNYNLLNKGVAFLSNPGGTTGLYTVIDGKLAFLTVILGNYLFGYCNKELD